MITTEWDRCQAAFSKATSDELVVPLDPITAVTSTRTWDFSLPTLTNHRRFTSRRTFASVNGNDDFLEIIKNHKDGLTYSLLEAIGVFNEQTDIVLYGGSLLDIVLQREKQIKDWDLRLIGEKYIDNELLCIERAKLFLSCIFSFVRERRR
jgi:hypothetical protein